MGKRKIRIVMILFICVSIGTVFAYFYHQQGDAKEKTDIAVSFCDTKNPRTTAMAQDVLEYIEQGQFSVRWCDAKSDLEKQKQDIQALMEYEPEYLVIVPLRTQGIEEELIKIDTVETKIILLDRTIDNFKNIPILAEVRTDAQWEGQACACLLKEYMGADQRNILEISGEKGSSINKMHSIGFRNQLSTYASLEIKGTVEGNGDRVTTRNNVINYFSNQTDEIHAIFANTDEEGIGAVEALEKLGLKDQITVVSVNGIQDAKNAIEAGSYYGCVEATPYLGKILINLIQRDMNQKEVTYANIQKGKVYTVVNINEMRGY